MKLKLIKEFLRGLGKLGSGRVPIGGYTAVIILDDPEAFPSMDQIAKWANNNGTVKVAEADKASKTIKLYGQASQLTNFLNNISAFTWPTFYSQQRLSVSPT